MKKNKNQNIMYDIYDLLTREVYDSGHDFSVHWADLNCIPFLEDEQLLLIEYIVERHKNQKRAGGQPYITHLLRVGELASGKDDMPFPREVGWCHDLLEDQLKEFNSLDDKRLHLYSKLMEFGYASDDSRYIVDRVMDLTGRYTKENYPADNWSSRAMKEVVRLSDVHRHSQTMKLCDVIDNLKFIQDLPLDFAKKYLWHKGYLIDQLHLADQEYALAAWSAYRDAEERLYEGEPLTF